MDNKREVETVPLKSDELLDLLEEVFPEESARLEWSDREVWFKAGQRAVVKWLLELKRREDYPYLEDYD